MGSIFKNLKGTTSPGFSVGDGQTADASASLHLTGTARGALLNRVTNAEMLAIPSPANGLLVFNTDYDKIFAYIAAIPAWQAELSEENHKGLRHLAHFIDDGPAEGFASGAYKETLPTGNLFPTSEIWWESAAKLKKLVSLDTTWTGVNITQEVWKVYDTDGATPLATITDVISYSGVVESNRTRTIS